MLKKYIYIYNKSYNERALWLLCSKNYSTGICNLKNFTLESV